MKKTLKMAVALALLVMVFTLTACTPRAAITAGEFAEKAGAAGYTIIDAKDQFGEGDVVEYKIAAKDGYQIEFGVVPTIGQANVAYNQNKANFELEKGNVSSNSEVNLSNYSKYTQNSDGTYYVVSRIDATFIYAKVDAKYKDEVSNFIQSLGY